MSLFATLTENNQIEQNTLLYLTMASTIAEISSQWVNPSDVTAVLMVIGGDVVQKALAQTTGCLYTPVCFSFGWVAYTFSALVGVLGDGRLLPAPDYPVKVFNLSSGYVRENKNWVVGRILRDLETRMSRYDPMGRGGIRISVWQARHNINRHTRHSYTSIHIWGFGITVVQLFVASIPLIIGSEQWGILLITFAGSILAATAGGLPQWTAEKLPNRQSSRAIYALTTGNGSKNIVVIQGADGNNVGNCLDLEELCASESPRSGRPWEKFSQRDEEASNPVTVGKMGLKLAQPVIEKSGSFSFHKSGTQKMVARTNFGLPVGFWFTLSVCVVQSVAWLLLLITVAALKTDTWYLILIGGIGMFQNGYLAAMERRPEHRNLPLDHVETIKTAKVMDGLMDLEAIFPGGAQSLLSEFFPGSLRVDEKDWWNGERDAYDAKRTAEMGKRGPPRSAGKMPYFESPYFKPADIMTKDDYPGNHDEKGAGKQMQKFQFDHPRYPEHDKYVRIPAPTYSLHRKGTSLGSLAEIGPGRMAIEGRRGPIGSPIREIPLSGSAIASSSQQARPLSTGERIREIRETIDFV